MGDAATNVRFETAKVSTEDGVSVSVFSCWLPEPYDLVFLAPASWVMVHMLAERFADAGAVQDSSVLTDRSDAFRAVMGHLVREEPWFDFDAGADALDTRQL